MHTTAEDTHEVEKDKTNMDKEKKEVENLFAEKGWTVKVSRNRMRSRKVVKVLRSGRCDCSTSQSSMIISELSQKKVERSEKLANMVRRNSDTVKLIAGLTVKQVHWRREDERLDQALFGSRLRSLRKCHRCQQNRSLDVKFKKRGRQNLDWCTRQPEVKKLPIWERSFCR